MTAAKAPETDEAAIWIELEDDDMRRKYDLEQNSELVKADHARKLEAQRDLLLKGIFDLEAEIKRVTDAYLSLEGPHIPSSIRKPQRPDRCPDRGWCDDEISCTEAGRCLYATDEAEAEYQKRARLSQPEPTQAERLLGRPVYRETRKSDMREMMRADRAGADDGCE